MLEAADVVTKASPRSVTETVSRLLALFDAKGLKVFSVIDQSAAARDVGLSLQETVLVQFGSPKDYQVPRKSPEKPRSPTSAQTRNRW